MNPAPGQGLAGRANAPNPQAAGSPNPQAAGSPNLQQVPQLYRPEDMRNVSFLKEGERAKYEKGLASLWRLHDGAAPGSREQEDAKKKLMEFGKMLAAKIHQRQQQQRRQQPLPQPGQGQDAAQPQQVPAAQGAGGPPGNMGNMGNIAAQPSTSGTQASPPMRAAPSQAPVLPPHIVSHVNDMQFQPPPTVPDKAKWLEEIKSKYATALWKMDTARNGIKAANQNLQENQSLTPDERRKYEELKAHYQKQYGDAIAFANLVRKQYGNAGKQRPAQNGGAGAGAGGQPRPPVPGAQGGVTQPGQGAGSTGGPLAAPANPMQSSTAAVNAAIEAAKKQQLAAGRVPGVVSALPAQQQGTPSLPQAHPSQAQAAATPAQAQQSPATQQPTPAQPTVSQPQTQHATKPLQQPVAPLKLEQGSQQVPSPLNTAIATAAAGGVPSAGTPTQNSARLQTPQSATPTTANSNIRPLSHADAVNKASQSVPGTVPAAAPGGTVPVSNLGGIGAGQHQQLHQQQLQQQQQQQQQQQHQQQLGHPHAHPSQPQPAGTSLHSKLPIPKVLHEKAAQMPTPVPNVGGIGNAGRPTYTGGSGTTGGVLNQPALVKAPAYQLEGEGERILNKKKLDELVRQVCGGTAEGQDGNLLTPEVEESVLTMADSFVDNVLHQACRNAKERGSKVLEIRDIQLVLERTYNIRIPGYSSEELRTVRKVQPNSSWIKKMSAVQAAKVVPGKGDL